ncbi:MAP kinase kinase (MEK) [Vermiconidia calcicola]|uniref:MAP kinase kinase (MEK) n=1 Tax=Vermiconidia calcicola TaxID=1690605 RepID=A0ACC3MHI4_9PEZI|nr:MAP kinase kinase (MEK) [Vermiconidia calcicola]
MSSNVVEHRCRIPMSNLPATFKDAIVMSRRLGFRYLWIDALCIIQDDLEDWRREAARMCSIYEGATLSLSAIDSHSSSTGFLHPRDHMSHPKHAIPSRAVETRAWTLQERVLAPAVIHFASQQLFWEYCAGFASESSPRVERVPIGENNSYYGVSVHDMKVSVRNQAIAADYDRANLWYQLVEEYTKRDLTRPSDRLPAIDGLSESFARYLAEDTHLSGLWLSSPHVGIWSSISGGQDKNCLVPNDGVVPSWSWASVQLPVRFECKHPRPGSHMLTPKAQFSVSLGGRKEAGSQSGHDQTTLEIQAEMKQGVCYQASSVPGDCRFVTSSSRWILDDIKCTLDRVEGHVREGHMVSKKYYCILVSEKHFTEQIGSQQGPLTGAGTKYYLVLEDLDAASTDECDMYTRVGIGWQDFWPGDQNVVFADAEERTVLLV